MARCGGSRLTQRALELAYRYLARRERTVSELRRHLLDREVDEATAETVIGELVEQGSVDDARFARLFVEDKRGLEQWGSDRIKRGLLARGIDRELADAVLGADMTDDLHGGELERALALLRQKFPVAPQGRRDRERALGLLLRKGYQSDLAIEALHAHRREEHQDRAA
jgi:regulatory protein